MKRVLSSAILAGLLLLPSVAQPQIPNLPGGINADFMGSLSKALGGASPTQSAGAAGSIFSLAKSRLSDADFGKVSKAVPGMDALLKAAPPTTGTVPATGLNSLASVSQSWD